ncbi:unnamed protein product [Linum trigynum]|uniref:BTB/POZ domain-containing protein TNFAIP1 n=1 Tax=Linum trigynum TaxID=586398 RepID=A0AAV2E2P5_9ROSI
MAVSSISIPTLIHQLFHCNVPHSSTSPSGSFAFPSSSSSFSFPASTVSISNPHNAPSLSISRASSSSSSSSSSSRSKSKTSTAKKKKKGKSGGGGGHGDWKDLGLSEVEVVEPRGGGRDYDDEDDFDDYDEAASTSISRYNAPPTTPLPNPPAGFFVSESGRVSMTSSNRIATIVDATNNNPLECVIRRVFRSSRGAECMLLCPVDTPVQILKSTNIDGWSAVSDDEVEAILPAAAYALAKINMHLVHSGFCYTARGGFCYSEDDIFDFRTDDGETVDGLPTEGVEITYFHLDGAHYMIYTPSDPLLFVAIKDQDGVLQIADDDLLEDSAIVSAIDEETEFNALVEEEAALMESLMGKS